MAKKPQSSLRSLGAFFIRRFRMSAHSPWLRKADAFVMAVSGSLLIYQKIIQETQA
jgi:hypothetical protein